MASSYLTSTVESAAGRRAKIPQYHPWECTIDRPNQFEVAGGKVYGDEGSSAAAEGTDVATSDSNTIVYLIVGVTSGTREVLNATLTSGTEVPDDTDTEIHIPIVRFRDLGGGSVYLVPDQLQNSEIYLYSGGASVNHPWKVTMTDEGEFYISGGTVHGNGGPFVVAPKTELIESGIIWVKITRDSSSREMTAAVIGSGVSVPTSDYTDQYRPIAAVDDAGSPPVLQLQFQELRVEELMIVANGEFELLSVDAAARNTYDPPV